MAEQDTSNGPAVTAPEMKRTASSGTTGTGSSRGRLPGLEDLAARMNITPSTSNTSTNASRPRLATSILRTNSHTGQPQTQSEQTTSGSGPTSTVSERAPFELPAVSVSDPNGEEVSGGAAVSKGAPPPRGYKNVPSLDAIAGRIKAQKEKDHKSGDVVSPAETPSVELEQGEIVEQEGDKPRVDLSELHPLRHKWTFYFDAKQPPPPRPAGGESTPVPYTPSNTESGEYEAGLNIVGKFKTSDIKPMWEDPANANGGKWVITMRNNPVLLDRCWSWLAMGLVGQELDDKDEIICGAVVSLRSKIDRIQLWIRQKDDVERVNAVGKRLVKLLDLEKEPGVQLEFQFNSDERAPASKYISIMPPQAQFRRGPETPTQEGTSGGSGGFFGSVGGSSGRGGGGAFGAFGQGRGAFGSGGRGSYGAGGAARTSTSPGTGGHGRTSSLGSSGA
ncbi:hypothetical protein FRC07_005476 [Ceratobasidium sp. 392]|nr:hypothetical protein FRC07_005476 [Ceratobasidium sp. 392]